MSKQSYKLVLDMLVLVMSTGGIDAASWWPCLQVTLVISNDSRVKLVQCETNACKLQRESSKSS